MCLQLDADVKTSKTRKKIGYEISVNDNISGRNQINTLRHERG